MTNPYKSIYFGPTIDQRLANLIETGKLLGIKGGRGGPLGPGPVLKRIADIPAPTLARILKPYIGRDTNEPNEA